MLHVSDTAYPRLKAHPTDAELEELFTPTLAEMAFALKQTRRPTPRVALLVLLKTFQRLGYFPLFANVPLPMIKYIATAAECPEVGEEIRAYDTSSYRMRHMNRVRIFLNVSAFDEVARRTVVEASVAAARTRDDLADIINITIEELVRHRYELPAFSTLARIARTARSTVNRGFHRHIAACLTDATKARLQHLLQRPVGESHTPWDRIKAEPQKPTLPHFRVFLDHLYWLRMQSEGTCVFNGIPDVKVRQFAAEAWALNAAAMNEMVEPKRLTLMAALLQRQIAHALDDVATLLIRQVQKMHNNAVEALQQYQVEQADQVDALIGLLRETVLAYQSEGSAEERLAAIAARLGPDIDAIVMRCEAHAALTGNNHFPFLRRFYHPRRAVLMQALASLDLRSTSQDTSVVEAVAFMLAHREKRRPKLTVVDQERLPDGSERVRPLLNLSFIADKWWPLVTGQHAREKPVTTVERCYFEVCVMTQVMLDLKSGDLYVPGSEAFGDYRQQLVSWEDYAREIAAYGEQAGVSTEGKAFIAQLRTELETAANHADANVPTNEDLRIENGVPILKRLRAKPDVNGTKHLERLLGEHIEPINIIDALIDTEYWLRWTRHFGPLSGLEAKLDNPAERYLVTAFCYGCNLGPTQTARSIVGLERRQLAFVNQRHVTEEKLNDAITTVVNAYARIGLQARWGSGQQLTERTLNTTGRVTAGRSPQPLPLSTEEVAISQRIAHTHTPPSYQLHLALTSLHITTI